MNIKKLNAVISLLLFVVLVGHMFNMSSLLLQAVAAELEGGATASASEAAYSPSFNPMSFVLFVLFITHAILSIVILRKYNDAGKIRHPSLNIRTIIQRASGILMLVTLIPFHIKNNFKVTLISSVLFYGFIFIHCAISISKALITLGVIKNSKSEKIFNIIMSIACAVFYAYGIYSCVVFYLN